MPLPSTQLSSHVLAPMDLSVAEPETHCARCARRGQIGHADLNEQNSLIWHKNFVGEFQNDREVSIAFLYHALSVIACVFPDV